MRIRLLAFLVVAASAYGNSGQIAVVGKIPCAGEIKLSHASPAFSVESREGIVRVRLTNASVEPVSIALSLRTNCSYHIAAELLGASGSGGIHVPPAQLSPESGGARLTSMALRAKAQEFDLRPNSQVRCLEGSRVSRAGNNLTPDNAVLVQFAPIVSGSAVGSSLVFTLHLGE